MKTSVRRSVEIKRTDAGRRVVYGEVMLAAPDMQNGDVVMASQLAGAIHFDGAFMTQSEITDLMDRFATKRPSVDVEHNGVPVGATVVESFQARAGDPEYAEGAWVVGVKLHDGNVWERVERGELRAFSIQFMVRVDDVNVTIVLDDGAQMPTQLIRFSNGDPQFLSLVHQPATGAMWNRIDRSMEVVLRDATTSRWTMDNKDEEAAATETTEATVVEETRSDEAKAEGLWKRVIKLIRRDTTTDEPRAEDDPDDEDDDDDDDAAFPGAAEAFDAKDGPDGDKDKESKKQGTTDPAAEVNRAEMFADLLAEDASTLRHGVDALAATSASITSTSEGDAAGDTEKMRAALMDFATWGSSMLDSEDGGLDAFVAELAERSADADVERGAFNAAIAAQGVREDVWDGAYTLMDTLSAIAASDATDKAAAMKIAVAEFGIWIGAKVDAMAAAVTLSAEAFDVSATVVERAGKKIAGKRLAALKDLATKLAALIEDLDDVMAEDVENSERSGDDPDAETASDDGTAPADAAEVDRSADSGDAAQATVSDTETLLQALEKLVNHNEKLEERLRTLETARQPASGAGGEGSPEGPKKPYATLASAFGFGPKQ